MKRRNAQKKSAGSVVSRTPGAIADWLPPTSSRPLAAASANQGPSCLAFPLFRGRAPTADRNGSPWSRAHQARSLIGSRRRHRDPSPGRRPIRGRIVRPCLVCETAPPPPTVTAPTPSFRRRKASSPKVFSLALPAAVARNEALRAGDR